MTEKINLDDKHEIERYEMEDESTDRLDLNRRQFIKLFGGGIAVLFVFKDVSAFEQAGVQPPPIQEMPEELGTWLHIQEDGAIKVYTGKAEMGQNIRTSLAQVVAEELSVPIENIKMVMGDTDLTPYDRGTFGSRSTPIMSPQLRKVGAATRELLFDLAAQYWNDDRNVLQMNGGKITNSKTKESIDFGQLTKGQKLVKTITDDEAVTHPKQWKFAGTSVPKVNGRSFVTGKHQYVSDMKLTDMLYGKILRPPAFKASLVSVDTAAAEAMSGVTVVVDGNFIGVAAPAEQTAERAVAEIRTEWKTTPQQSRVGIFEYFRNNVREGGRRRSNNSEGSMEAGLAAADKTLQQSYTIDYIAHVPLEPRAALAKWEGDKLTVWTGTQRPFGVHEELVEVFQIPEDRVRVIMPDTGSGYGGKHTGDAAIEAARLSKAAGKPVKIVWTREEEFTWAYFRPGGVIDINSGIRNDGTITAWEFHNYNSGGSSISPPYEIKNQKIQFHRTESPLRQGSYRVLAATANIFARECHIDDLANMISMDPLEFRLKNLKDPRLRATLEAAAKKFGWGKSGPAPNHGFGIACGFEKGGCVATCAEISVDPRTRKVTVVRVVEAFEAGAIVNPDHLENQIQGCIMQGLGGALFEYIDFENGKILNPSLSRYRVPRFSDTPVIEVVMLDRKDLPAAGGGETPIAGIAPAIGNAIFNATGVRLRSLPLTMNGRMK